MLLFPEEVPKNNRKTKDLGVLGKQRIEESKFFLGYLFRKIQGLGGKL